MRLFLFGMLIIMSLSIHGGEEVKKQINYLAYGKDIQVTFIFSSDETLQKTKTITVNYKNISPNKGTLRLPTSLKTNEDKFPDNTIRPLLILILKNEKGHQQEFGLTSDVNSKICLEEATEAEVTIPAGEKYSAVYLLSHFWIWGSCGINNEGCFTKTINMPGPQSVSIKICLMQNEDKEKYFSNEIIIKCSYPNWIFSELSQNNNKK